MTPRTYHCVNRMLHAATTLILLGICGYAIYSYGSLAQIDFSSKDFQILIAIATAIIAPIWGSYFWRLCFTADESGVSKRVWSTKKLNWEEITDIDFESYDQNGQAHSKVSFKADDGRYISISSELLSLEDMEELVTDLRSAGKLPEAPSDEA